jgi:hypothetical protein
MAGEERDARDRYPFARAKTADDRDAPARGGAYRGGADNNAQLQNGRARDRPGYQLPTTHIPKIARRASEGSPLIILEI